MSFELQVGASSIPGTQMSRAILCVEMEPGLEADVPAGLPLSRGDSRLRGSHGCRSLAWLPRLSPHKVSPQPEVSTGTSFLKLWCLPCGWPCSGDPGCCKTDPRLHLWLTAVTGRLSCCLLVFQLTGWAGFSWRKVGMVSRKGVRLVHCWYVGSEVSYSNSVFCNLAVMAY